MSSEGALKSREIATKKNSKHCLLLTHFPIVPKVSQKFHTPQFTSVRIKVQQNIIKTDFSEQSFIIPPSVKQSPWGMRTQQNQ